MNPSINGSRQERKENAELCPIPSSVCTKWENEKKQNAAYPACRTYNELGKFKVGPRNKKAAISDAKKPKRDDDDVKINALPP